MGKPLHAALRRVGVHERRSRNSLLYGNAIPDDADIVITHSPPRGMLDLTFDSDKDGTPIYRLCGSQSLAERINEVQPALHCFGHIHNSQEGTFVFNAGTRLKAGSNTIYSNGSCSTDGMWGELTSHGNTIKI